MCPMWKHLYSNQLSTIGSQKDLEPVIKEYFELKGQNQKNKERLDELKTLIYGFMDEAKVERVFGQEGYITKSAKDSVSYNMEKVREILEPAGKWQEILSTDEKKLEKLLSSLPQETQEKLFQLRSTKQIITLTISKKKMKDAEED